jgi:hypothetical protein
MSVYLYDNAVIDYLTSVWDNNKINILPTELAFENNARLRDRVNLPLITVNRLSPISIEEDITNWARSRIGVVVPTEDNKVDYMIRTIGILISYNIDTWTRTRKENDDIVRELIWLLLVKPTLKIKSPYGINKDWSFSLMLEPDIEDNSDIIAFSELGEYYRQTLTIYTSGAMLFLKNNHPQASSIETEVITTDSSSNI